MDTHRWRKGTVALSLFLLVLHSLLLIDGLHLGLWVDEGFSVAATEGDWDHVTAVVAADVHPPLYFYALYLWRQFSGDSVFALRYFAVLTALVAGVFTYRLGHDLGGRATGFIAWGYLVTNDLALVLGREIRQYPLAYLLCALTVWAYGHLWQAPSRRRRQVMFVVSGAALLWTHYWGGFVLLSLGCHALFTRRRQIRAFVLTYATAGVLFLPWVLVVIRQLSSGEVSEGLGHAMSNNWDTLRITTFQLLGTPEVLWIVLLLYGLLGVKRSAAAAVVIITVGLTALINEFYAVLTYRALSLLIPCAAVLIGQGLASFHKAERGIMVLALGLHALLTTGAGPPVRLPWAAVATYVETGAEVVLIETWQDTYALAYYLDLPYIPSDLKRRELDDPDALAQYLEAELAPYDRIWIVRFSSDHDLRQMLEGWQVVTAITWPTDLPAPIEIWLLARRD